MTSSSSAFSRLILPSLVWLSVSLLAIGSASAASADKIYFTASTNSSATTDSLNRIDADGTNQTVLAADTANFVSPDMCAVDSAAGFVWVADGAGSFKLIRYDLNGSLASRNEIYTANTNQIVRGVMVHTASQKLYVITNSATAADDRLIQMNYDGSGAVDLAAGATHFQNPAYGCIDPVRGYVYVADNFGNNTSAGLLRYNLDGTGRTQVKTWTELNPNPGTITAMAIQGVAVDRSTGQIYVVTSSGTATADRVQRVNADFSGLVELMAGSANFNNPVSIHVDRARNRLLVGDLGTTTAVNIFAFDLNGGNRTTFTTVTATAGIGYTAGIALHSLTAPAISDVVNQNVAMNGNTGALAVTVNDAETALSDLLVYGTSSNTTLVPDANIVTGGSGGSRTVTVTPAAGQTGSATITLYVDDGQRQTTDTFTVNVTAPSNNADLAALTTTASGFAPTFAAGTTAYTANVPNATTSVTVTATRADANATLAMQVNGGGYTALTSGSASSALPLNVGPNPIDVRVTAQDGTTIKTYTITVTRAAPLGTIAPNDLMVIAYNSSEDIPVDSIALLATANIPDGTTIFLTDRGWQVSTSSLRTTSVLENTVTWVTSGVTAGKIIRIATGTPNATTVGVSDVVASFIGTTYGVLSGSLDPDLTSGDQILIYTTADNNSNSTPTFIHAFNADAPSLFNAANDDGPLDGWSDSDTSNLNNTSKLPPGLTAVLATGDGGSAFGIATYVNSGADEFDNYIYNGPTSQTTRELWIARITTFANWLGRDTTTYDTQTAGALSPANSNYQIGAPLSNNADLAALTTTASGFAPTFAAGTTAYTANVQNATTSVTVTATSAEANATMQVRVNGGSFTALTSGSPSSALALNVGTNPIDVRVTAQDGTTQKTYTLTVTRAGVPPNLSVNDVTLNEGNSGTTTFSFTVSLSAPAPVGGVTFDIATANGSATQPSDYTQTSLTAQTIPAGSSSYTFNVPVVGDTTVEPTENFFVNVTNITNAIAVDSQGTGSITNDDVVVPPTITSVSPARGPIAGGTTVVITGTGFTGASAVNFGTTPATGFTVNSPTQITATLPAGTGGIFDISVVTGTGTGTGSGLFYYFTTTGGTPAIAASKVDIFTPNGAGKVLPGAPIQYRTLIANTGAGDATTVDFADSIPANTTLVPGSVNVSPLAEDNVYSTIVNTQLAAGTPTVLSGPVITSTVKVTDNDREFLTDTFTISAFDATSAAGGSVVMVTSGVNMGSFTYVPAPGFVGADSFTYTLRDDGTDSTAGNADDLTGVGIVVINVVEADTVASGTQKVWYIDGSYAGANGAEDGTSARPFNALSDVSGASGLDAAGDTLYLAAGNYTGGITLLADQSLIGANQALVLNSVTLAAAGTDPVITNVGSAGVTLATGNTLRGFTIGDTGVDISGTAAGNLTISNVNCSGQGGFLSISTSAALAVTIDSAVSTSSVNAVSLIGTTGTCTFTGGSIAGATGDDFVVSGGTAVISYGGTITNSTGRSVNVASKTGGSVTFSGAITDTAGSTGVSLTSNTGSTINFTGGLSLTTTSNAAFTATGGGTVNVTGSANTLTTTTATALNVANTTIGASGLTFQSITAGTASGTAGVGISLDTTGSLGGLTVTGTGTPGSGGTIQRKTGANLSRANGIGIYLNNTANVSLTRMQLNDFDNFAIRGFGVSGFTLANCVINGVNGNSTANLGGTDEQGEGAVYFGNAGVTNSDGLNGTVSITNSTIQGGSARNLSIADTASTSVMRATISGCTFGVTQNLLGGNQSLAVEARNSGTTSHVSVTNSIFTGSMSDAMNFTGQTGTTMHVIVGGAGVGNTITNSHPGNNIGGGSMVFASQGIMFFDARNNTMSGANGSAVTIFKANLGTQMEGTFDSNVIGTTGVASSGSATGNGIFLSAAGAGAIKLAITNNIIQRYNGNAGIYADNTDGSYTVDMTVTGNTFRQPGAGVFAGLAVTNGAPSSADTTNVFLRALNNDFSDSSDPLGGGADIYVTASGSAAGTHTFTLSGATAGDVASLAAIQTFLKNNNNLNGAAAATSTFASVDAPATLSQFRASASLPAAPGAPLPLLFAETEPGTPDLIPDSTTASEAKAAVLTSKTAPKPLLAEKALTNENLQKLVLEAKARWIASGLTSEQKAALEALRIEISDLNELHLGQAAGDLIQISRTAAGNAWFIDQTPSDDAEFERRTGFQPVSSDNGLKVRSTVEGVDLLTTLMHEMGHRLGLPDTYALRDRSSIMYGYLTRGERRLPAPNQARGAVLSTDETQRYLGATINIGTLPAGKSVTIVGTVLVNDPANTQLISSQGTVSGGNFASVLTDDPAFAGAANPTTTLVERPDATVVSLLRTDSNPNNTSDVGWQVVFSQPVSGLNVSHFALVNAGLTAPSITSVGTAIQASEPDTTWNISVSTGSGNGTLGLNMTNDAGALSHDITNLPSTGQVYTIDKIAPTTNNFNRQIPTTSSTNADTLVFRAIFSEAVVNVSADDFTITGTTATPTAVSAVNASTYDVTVSGGDLATVNGLVDLNLVAGNNIADLAGNPLASLLVGFDQLYTMDNTVPTVAMTSATGNPAANAVIPVTVQFSETVTGFDLTDITVAGGSKGNFVAVDGDTYTFDLTPTGPGVTVTADIAANAAQDAATNGNTAATQFTRSIVDAVSIAATTATAAEGGATGLYTFTRGASTGDLTVSFQLDAGSTATAATDFTLTSGGTLTFTPGTGAGTIVIPNGSLTATVTLTALTESPNAAEAAETARLNVVAASGYVVGASPNATVTITENSFLVTTTSDSGTGSLRQAVLNANSLAGSDTITFSDGTGGTVNFTDTTPETITVNVGGTLLLSSSLIVEGPGADRLSISGNNATGVFSVGAGSLDVTLSKLSIINGSAPNRGGIVSGSSGVLRVTQCTLSGNTSVVGAAILNTGTGSVLVAQSTISGNTASNSGGAISNFSTGSVTLVQCTLSGNNASSGNGGGINNASTGSITVLQSTVTSNTASGTGGGIRNVGAGVVTIANTTIAGNTGGGNPDVEGAFTSNGGNLIGNAGTATGFINGVNNDQVGNGASPINPQLAALANNGGPTRTHALLAGSPALNAGLPANIPADTFDLDGDTNVAEPIPFDQRGTGFTRAIGTVDIGAFEAAPPEITVFDGSGIAGAQRTDNTGGHSFGVVAVGTSSVPQTFTIQNTGNGPMALGTLTVTGLQQGEFSVTQPVSTTLTPNATTTFTVTFSPTATGWKNAIINIPSNDADENPFRIIVRGANAGSPDQMPLPGQTNTFPGNARGYWFTAPTDMTIVGVRVPTTASTGAQSIAVMRFNAVPPVFSASTNAFTTLYLTQNNPDSGVLSVNIPVTAGTIIGVLGTRGGLNSYAPGDLDTFILGMPVRLERLGMQFPLGTTAPRDIWREFGSSTSISRVDLYTLPGTPAVQEIAVEGNAANISNGDTTPDSADHTDFGSNPVNTGSVTRTFTVRNTSIHALNVTLGSISISGPNAGDFTVTSAPPSSVLSSTSATFQVTFDPSAPGLRTATLSIPNNDGDENPFTFALQGTGLPPVVSLATANAGDADAVEGSVNTGLYTFTRSDSEGPLTVGFQLHPSSTATAGTDFTLSGANSFSSTTGAGTVTFANGSTTATVTLTALVESPNGAEAAETARLDLLANPGVYDLGATTTATVSIAPNSFLVINTNDSGTGSLRQALSNADAISGDDVIAFDATVFATAQTIVVTSELGINSNVIIPGPAAGLTVQAASTAANVFNVLAGVVTFRELTISNGSNGLVKNSSADLTVIGCTIVGNLNNGFVANTATSHLINSTFSGNGTGIAQILPMPLVNVTNCTISGNTTGLSSGGGVSLRNTLCVGNNTNTSGPFTNAGGNIATGTAAAAGLAASLQNNGGPTQTYALLNGSPAINAGVNALAVDQNNVSLGFDQRGAPNLRIRGPVVDIGAVEAFAFEPTITASTTDEDTQSTSGLVVSANTADGGLTTHYKITGILNGTLFQNDGTTVIAEGSYITKAEGAAGLKFTPSLNLNTPNTPAGFGFSAQAAIGTSAGDERGVAVPVVITVNSINDLPTVVAPGLPDIRLTIGDVVVIPLGANFADVDLQTLTFTVSGNTVPAKASASITGTTNVTVTGLTFGVTDLTIQADDGTMGLVTDTFQVAVGTVNPTPTMPATPPAGWRVNSQTALFDIDVPVQNTTAFDINGFRLTVDLSAYAVSHPTLRLINYSSPAGVLPAYVDYPYPVAIGETVNVRLSFFVATRVMPNPFNPTLTVTKLTTSAVAGPLPAGTYTQAVIQKNEAGRILLTWPSTPGRWYRIYYSANLTTWTPSATPIQASANQVQWIDSGAPFTQTPPAGSRFYQVTEIPAPAPAPPP